MSAIVIVILVLAILLVIFTLQNSVEITIQFFFWEIVNAPLVLVLLGCIVLGYIITSIYFYPRLWNLKSENKRLNKLNKKNEELMAANQNKNELDENHPEGIRFEDDDDSFSIYKD